MPVIYLIVRQEKGLTVDLAQRQCDTLNVDFLMSQHDAVWLTWEDHRRSRELATALHVPIVRYPDTFCRPSMYLLNALRTIGFLIWARPKAVVTQNPSLVLAWLALLLKRVLRYSLILDNHNQGVAPELPFLRASIFRPLYWRLHAGADMNIVSNDALAKLIEAHGGKACVLPDKLPSFVSQRISTSVVWPPDAKYKLIFICTYATDEPVSPVIDAARLLQGTGLHIFVTGKPPPNISSLYGPLPANCHLLGFLSEDEFRARLQTCDAIMDLTERENCLLCGAYEAVAVAKPLLTSDTAALRAYFRQGAVYTRHTPEAIATGIQSMQKHHHSLSEEMRRFQLCLEQEWQHSFQQFSLFFDSVIIRKTAH
jgi:hypothetical protein